MNESKIGHLAVVNASKELKGCNVDINLEEDVIKYYLMPSLHHISASNIIITLWSQADIKHQIRELFNERHWFESIYNSFSEVEDKVSDKVLQLPLPYPIKKRLANIIHPIGNEIINWILYQDEFIFKIYYGDQDESTALNCIVDLVWTSRGVIDQKKTAKALLAKEEKISDNHQYKVACTYCLEEAVANIAPKVNKTALLKYVSILWHAMLHFWTARITGDFATLDDGVRCYNRQFNTNYSTNKYMFVTLSSDDSNEIAIKYIWDKLDNEEKSRQIIPAIRKSSNIDIICFFLSQMSKEQVKAVFRSVDASDILLKFLDNWLWGHYFLYTMHHIWYIIPGSEYLNVLEGVTSKMSESADDTEKYILYKAILKDLWQCAPKHLKGYVFRYRNGIKFNHSVLFNLSWEKNVDLVKSILFDSNDMQKKKVIFSEKGIDKCEYFITSNQWDLLEMFVGSTLPSKDDVECFKRSLIREKGRNIAEHFMRNKEWVKAEQFIQWTLKTEEENREFRQKLAHGPICDIILQSMVEENKAHFVELEQFFKWCALDDEEAVLKYKASVPEFYFSEFICKLIEEGKYELLEQILNWCFVKDRTQIHTFKQNMYNDNKIFNILELVFILVRRDDQLQSLKKFADYWCSTAEEINKLKTYLLNTGSICLKLFRLDKYELADDFVIWCCNSSQVQIDEFKNQLMINNIMMHFPRCYSMKSFETKFIIWCNPSIATLRKFEVI